MKKILLTFLAFITSTLVFAQETHLKQYSYTEFFNLIEQETDTVFILQDAEIKYDAKTDSLFKIENDVFYDSIPVTSPQRLIDKRLELKNVHFLASDAHENETWFIVGVMKDITFSKPVIIKQSISVFFYNCTFKQSVRSSLQGEKFIVDYIKNIREKRGYDGFADGFSFKHSQFFGNFWTDINLYPYDPIDIKLEADHNIFSDSATSSASNNIYIFLRKGFYLGLTDNEFRGKANINVSSMENQVADFSNNKIPQAIANFTISEMRGYKQVQFIKNSFSKNLYFDIDDIYIQYRIDWLQMEGKLFSMESFVDMMSKKNQEFYFNSSPAYFDSLDFYLEQHRYENKDYYDSETTLRAKLLAYYSQKLDKENENAVFREVKEMETHRLKFLYHQHSSFRTFFKWKINQFLKIFSDYGTEPAKAIVFSLYVILLFALIYLFFPNSWDQHGRHRIMHRYTFFMKYLNRKQGIHEVYLEEKQPELLAFHEFKDMIESNSKTVPRFFTATALPLYKWSLSGTKLSAAVLSKVDVMKGTWQEVPPAHRWWKALLLIGAFLLALAWDVLIKILNALMLSINTFTTLGFGEIPIKGLPRYLAIIQGFIGWFMLTIFSVSLISQLLN